MTLNIDFFPSRPLFDGCFVFCLLRRPFSKTLFTQTKPTPKRTTTFFSRKLNLNQSPDQVEKQSSAENTNINLQRCDKKGLFFAKMKKFMQF